jgi:hypothetical protein
LGSTQARGALDTSAAQQAEEAVAGCRACSDWLAGLAGASVSRGVAEAVASFRVPRQRPAVHRWGLHAAAAAVLLIAGATVWRASEQGAPPETSQPAAAATSSSTAEPAPRPSSSSREILSANDFESSNLDGWRVYPPS